MKLFSSALVAAIFVFPVAAQETPKPVTVPITLDHNRIIIDVYLPLPDGNTKRVRALFDLGNPRVQITESLAKKLGLPISGEPEPPSNPRWHVVAAPSEILIGTMRLPLTGIKDAEALINVESIEPGTSAEINLPSTLIRNYDVVLDYPNRQLTIGPPRTIQFEGSAVDWSHGLPITIAGKRYTFSLNLGESVGFVSPDLMSAWTKAHPNWPHMSSALGAANSGRSEPGGEVLLVPRISLGPVTLIGALFRSQRTEMYESGYVGPDALLNYRVGLDFVHSRLYLKQLSTYQAPGMDVIGLILRAEPDERYTILGVADFNGKPAVPDVRAGDALVQIDGAPATGATLGQVWSLLGGSPGQTRLLTLERAGKRFTVVATVHRFLAQQSNHRSPAKIVQKELKKK